MRCDRLAAAAATLMALAGAPGVTAAEPDAARHEALAHLVRHDCGSCHGLTLNGGLGPPLTAPALAGKPEAVLEAVILHGRRGTPMPPWAGLLTGEEVRWIVRALKSGSLR